MTATERAAGMTGTERARRSNSLYYDTSAISRRVLCDMVSNLESDLEESKTENAKLWKLASLVSEYISHDRCEGCVVKTACNSHELDMCWMVTELCNQLCELGIEVGND